MAYSDYLLAETGLAGRWVKLVNNGDASVHISDAATAQSGLFTFSTPPPSGIYTVYTGASSGGPWQPTGDTGYTIGGGGGGGGVTLDTNPADIQPLAASAAAGATTKAADAGHVHQYTGLALATDLDAYGTALRLLWGAGVPDPSLGVNGNLYFRADGGGGIEEGLYLKTGGTWAGLIGSLPLHTGNGVPSGGVGFDGHFYFRLDSDGTALTMIYRKVSGAWVGIV